MPGPERYNKCVAFLPMEWLAVDHCCPAAAEGVVDARAGVAVRFGFFVGAEHLDSAGHCRQRWTTGCGIDEFKRGSVEWIPRCSCQSLQRRVSVAPVVVQCFRRRAPDGPSHAVERCGIHALLYREAPLVR